MQGVGAPRLRGPPGADQGMRSVGGPPGQVACIEAERALVLAPHYDDEVLGCGGLLIRLAASGARVRVLFLSDSSGGLERPVDPDGYGALRRAEAAKALAVLGIGKAGELGLPDGRLAEHRESLADGIRAALVDFGPDLVLVPSPLENSSDHRAAFAALFDVLSPLRGDDRLAADLSIVRVLLYEVNQPLANPDLLVDVSGETAKLRRAMRCYGSQQERHGYLAAALGLRSFRTLTLGPQVRAAEAYRRLELSDFTTRSESQLLRHLGGAPKALSVDRGPRVSMVVRTRNRPLLLRQALDSLALNGYGPLEVVLVNDGGRPPQVSNNDYAFELVRVDLEENQGRAAAAQAGVDAATGEYVGFLDDDDLVAPEHLSTLSAAVQESDVEVVYSDAAVGVYALDDAGPAAGPGWRLRERRLPYSRDFDPRRLVLDNYIPFNTLLMDRRLLVSVGPFDSSLPFLEDWDMLIRLAQRTSFHHLRRVTCEYRHFEGAADQVFGSHPAEREDFIAVKARILRKHAEKLTPELLARAIVDLRREQVEAQEDARVARAELMGLREGKPPRLWSAARAHLARWRRRG